MKEEFELIGFGLFELKKIFNVIVVSNRRVL